MTIAAPARPDGTSGPTTRVIGDFHPDAAARRLEYRSYRRFVRLFGAAVPQPAASRSTPVLLVPGFVSGDVSMNLLSRHLRRAGHRTFRSEIGANVGCTDTMVERLLRRLEAVVADEGRPVALVGHSRGGMVVAIAARRRPDLVASVVVLSSPVTGTLAVATHVRKQLQLLFRLHRRGLRSVLAEDCVLGSCADGIADELDSEFPAQLPFTSVYSRADAIIDWHTCLAPGAELVEVTASHSGMGTDPEVLDIVSERLAALERVTGR